MSNMLACFSPESECPVVLDNVTNSMDETTFESEPKFDSAVDQDIVQNNNTKHLNESQGIREAEILTNKDSQDTLIDNKETVGYDCVDGMRMPQKGLSESKNLSEELKSAGDNIATSEMTNTECLRASDCGIKNEGDGSEIHSVEQGRFVISGKNVDEPALKLTGVATGESPTEIEGGWQAKMEGAGKDLVSGAVPDINRKKKKPFKVTIGNGYSIDSGTSIVLSPEDDGPAELTYFGNIGSFHAARGQPIRTEAQNSKPEVTDGGLEEDTSSSNSLALPPRSLSGRQRLGYSESFSPGDTTTTLLTSGISFHFIMLCLQTFTEAELHKIDCIHKLWPENYLVFVLTSISKRNYLQFCSC